MVEKRTLRDESTPIGKEIWGAVDKAAAKAPSPNPTPKPTAEELGEQVVDAIRCFRDEPQGSNRLDDLLELVGRRFVDSIRAQAFEEAEELRPRPPMGMQDGYVCAWADAVRAYAAAIRALAREKP